MAVFVQRSRFDHPRDAVFGWHFGEGALERLTPPWEEIEVLHRNGNLANGGTVDIAVRVGPLRQLWRAEHYGFEPGRVFHDRQVRGPFARWDHRHAVEPAGRDACVLEDRIDYALPGGGVAHRLAGGFVRRKLARTFAYRHATLAWDLDRLRSAGRRATERILVTGASGLVGSALVPLLTTSGFHVVRATRGASAPAHGTARWDPHAGTMTGAELEGIDAVVHLAAASVADGRWTAARKAEMRASRVDATASLCAFLAGLARPPRVLVSASAVGLYGDRGDETLDEASAPGHGFLPELARDWEAATAPARDAGIRVVNLRIGVVLTPRGGALSRLLRPFSLGAGGRIGGGSQWVSWVSIEDVIGAIWHALVRDDLAGPVNCVAPQPVRNRELAHTLGRVLRRPSVLPLPAAAVRALFGEMGEDLLLASTRVEPRALAASGYRWRHPDLEPALRELLGRPA